MTEENHENNSLKLIGVLASVRTYNFQNTTLELYRMVMDIHSNDNCEGSIPDEVIGFFQFT
jgi:hypothetical protein